MIVVGKYDLLEALVTDPNISLRFLRVFWRLSVLCYLSNKKSRVLNPSFDNLDFSLAPILIKVSNLTRASDSLSLNTIRLVVAILLF